MSARSLSASVLIAAVLAGACQLPEAQAAELSWKVGECYTLTDAQLAAEVLPTGVAPVACTEPHNVEVAFAQAVDVSTADRRRSAQRRYCSTSQLYKAVGLPLGRTLEGARAPVPMPRLMRSAWRSEAGDHYVCAAWAEEIVTGPSLTPGDGVTAKMVTQPLAAYGPETIDWDAAGLCVDDMSASKAKSVPCGPRRGFVMWRVVNFSAQFGRKIPSEAKLRAYAVKMCSVIAPDPWNAWYPLPSYYRQGDDTGYCFKPSLTGDNLL